MPSIPQALYNQIVALDNFTCVYCGRRTPELHIDHLVPRSVGGPDVIHNLVTACQACNFKKSDHPLHKVGMNLLYGRFARSRMRKDTNVYPFSAEQNRKADASPKVERLQVSSDERSKVIAELARELTSDGKYRYSANTILKMVGGTAADVKSKVAAERGTRPAPVVHPKGVRLARPESGW